MLNKISREWYNVANPTGRSGLAIIMRSTKMADVQTPGPWPD
jgi:hypothetical protein